MASLSYIQYVELMVGKGHPTASDTLNRALRGLLTVSGWDPDSASMDLYTLPTGKALAAHAASFDGNVNLVEFAAGNSGTALTIDWNNGNNQLVTLTGSCTFTFSNPKAGAVYTLELTQDGTGSRTATWPGTVTWPGGTAPTLTTTINKSDLVTFKYNGTAAKYRGVTSGLNYT